MEDKDDDSVVASGVIRSETETDCLEESVCRDVPNSQLPGTGRTSNTLCKENLIQWNGIWSGS